MGAEFDNLHQVLRTLYTEMMPMCGDMIGVAKGIAGLGALFYVALRVWQTLARAEPIDVYPLLRPFALGLCILFFPMVLETINGVLSPVVQGTHKMLEKQTFSMDEYRKLRDKLEYEAMVKNPETAYLVSNEEFDTLRTFFLIVLSILGPIAFAISVWDGFQSTLTQWFTRYISIYLWLPVADLFSSMLAKIQELMLKHDITQLQNDPTYTIDASNGVYLVFMIIGIIGYFTIPTVAGWVIQAGGAGNFGKNVNYAAGKGAGIAGAVGGAVGGFAGGHARNAMSYAGSKAKDVAGRLFHRGGNKSPESSEQN